MPQQDIGMNKLQFIVIQPIVLTNGWKNSKKQQIENYEIIKKLWEYVEYPKGRWTVKKCAGHKGIIGNELADALAKNDKEKIKNLLIKIEGDGKNGINL